jgi:hypothetical protein
MQITAVVASYPLFLDATQESAACHCIEQNLPLLALPEAHHRTIGVLVARIAIDAPVRPVDTKMAPLVDLGAAQSVVFSVFSLLFRIEKESQGLVRVCRSVLIDRRISMNVGSEACFQEIQRMPNRVSRAVSGSLRRSFLFNHINGKLARRPSSFQSPGDGFQTWRLCSPDRNGHQHTR